MERLQWWLLLLSAVMFSMSGCSSTRAWKGTALSDWDIWKQHNTHFASPRHLAFSAKSHPTEGSITEADKANAAREGWWGNLVPQEKMVFAAKPKPSTPTVASSDDTAPTVAPAPPKESWWRRGKKKTLASTGLPPAASAPAPGPETNREITGMWRGRWAANGSWGERRESDASMLFMQSGSKGTSRMVLTDTVAATGVPEVVRHFGALGTPMNIRVSRSEVLARFEDGPAVLLRLKRDGDRLYGRIDGSPSFFMVLEREQPQY